MYLPTLVPFRTPRRRSLRGVDSWFEDLFKEFDPETFNNSKNGGLNFAPQIDLIEDEGKITVSAELPGLTEEDVDISLKADHIVIRGHKKQEHEEKEGDKGYYLERSYGEFQRVIPLGVEVDTDQVDASMKNGVLTIVLPKFVDERKERKVSIRKG